MSGLPKAFQEFPADAPRYLAVPGFEVEIPAEYDPDTLDRLGVYVEAAVLLANQDFGVKDIYEYDHDADGKRIAGTKRPTGRKYRTSPRWVYKAFVVAGSPAVKAYEPAPQQMRLLDEAPGEGEES